MAVNAPGTMQAAMEVNYVKAPSSFVKIINVLRDDRDFRY